MQWDAGPNAGFSTAKATWLPVAPSYTTRNVAGETNDPDSLLNYYKALIRLRKTNPAIRDGDFAVVNENDKNVLAFIRKVPKGNAVVIALNFTSSPQRVSLNLQAQGVQGKQAISLLQSFPKRSQSNPLNDIVLPAYGAYVGQVQ